MIKGTTKSGFEFSVNESTQNNMELLDALAELDDGNIAYMPKVATMILGKEQKKQLYDHIRTEDGTVPVDKFVEEIQDIFAAFSGTEKNS